MRKLELKSVIENNELALEFQDLTKAQERACKAEIEKCKKELAELEGQAEQAEKAPEFDLADVTHTVTEAKGKRHFEVYYKGVKFAERKTKRTGQEAYTVLWDGKECVMGTLGKLKSVESDCNGWKSYFHREGLEKKAYIKYI